VAGLLLEHGANRGLVGLAQVAVLAESERAGRFGIFLEQLELLRESRAPGRQLLLELVQIALALVAGLFSRVGLTLVSGFLVGVGFALVAGFLVGVGGTLMLVPMPLGPNAMLV
jgi:hypothetical protein